MSSGPAQDIDDDLLMIFRILQKLARKDCKHRSKDGLWQLKFLFSALSHFYQQIQTDKNAETQKPKDPIPEEPKRLVHPTDV